MYSSQTNPVFVKFEKLSSYSLNVKAYMFLVKFYFPQTMFSSNSIFVQFCFHQISVLVKFYFRPILFSSNFYFRLILFSSNSVFVKFCFRPILFFVKFLFSSNSVFVKSCFRPILFQLMTDLRTNNLLTIYA